MATATPFAPLPRDFYARPADVVANDVLGKILVFERDGVTLAGRIVEAEAYLGIRDQAAHTFGGRRTARNEVMWGPPGFAYVFFVYGMHFHLNLVTDTEGRPCAVLLRAVEPLLGEEVMRALRGSVVKPTKPALLTNGPGKLCQAFGVSRAQNGVDLCARPLYLSAGTSPKRIKRCSRIGVDYAGAWARRLLRFVDADSKYLSVRPK
jgi:DNA-3-methyladenine glycosylase